MALNGIYGASQQCEDKNQGKLTVSLLIQLLVASRLPGTAITNATGIIVNDGAVSIDVPRPDYEKALEEFRVRIWQMEQDRMHFKSDDYPKVKKKLSKLMKEHAELKVHNIKLLEEVLPIRKAAVRHDDAAPIGGLDFGQVTFQTWIATVRSLLKWDIRRMSFYLGVSKQEYGRWEHSKKPPAKIKRAGAKALIADLKADILESYKVSGRRAQRIPPDKREFLGLTAEGLPQDSVVAPKPRIKCAVSQTVEPRAMEVGAA